VIHPADYIPVEEIARLRRRSQWRSIWMILHAWGVVFAAMAMFVAWPNPLTFLLAVMLIGARQLGMAILVHDAAHGALFRNRKLNDWVSDWLLAFPVLTDTKAYRAYHLEHHKYAQQPKDPDIGLSAPFPITKSSFRRKLWRDVTGRTGLKQRRAQIRAAIGAPEHWRAALGDVAAPPLGETTSELAADSDVGGDPHGAVTTEYDDEVVDARTDHDVHGGLFDDGEPTQAVPRYDADLDGPDLFDDERAAGAFTGSDLR